MVLFGAWPLCFGPSFETTSHGHDVTQDTSSKMGAQTDAYFFWVQPSEIHTR